MALFLVVSCFPSFLCRYRERWELILSRVGICSCTIICFICILLSIDGTVKDFIQRRRIDDVQNSQYNKCTVRYIRVPVNPVCIIHMYCKEEPAESGMAAGCSDFTFTFMEFTLDCTMFLSRGTLDFPPYFPECKTFFPGMNLGSFVLKKLILCFFLNLRWKIRRMGDYCRNYAHRRNVQTWCTKSNLIAQNVLYGMWSIADCCR